MEDPDPQSITATPAKDQLISHENKQYTTVQEGQAYILVPPNARTSVNPNAKARADEEQKVFYNPIQQFNRDLSVLAIKAYGEDLCRRKTIAREVKGKKVSEKKERKKQKQRRDGEGAKVDERDAGGSGAPEKDVSAEATKVDQATSSNKRKRADEDEDGEGSEGRFRKVQRGGDANESHGETELPSADVPANGTANSTNGALSDDAPTASSEQRTSDAVNGEGSGAEPGKGTHHSSETAPKPWQPSFRILDALSATGLRALRYATEIPAATSIVANDRDRGATAAIALNVQHNDLTSKITTCTSDAMGHMYAAAFPPPHSHGPNHISGKYDVIDLDPYGTAAPFIDAALQAINDEGMLCVTCTDSGVWASCGYSEKTFSLYGGMPIKGTHAHEGGLRLILHSIATSAAKYSLAIEPLLSLSIDFYARVFIRVRKSPADVKFLAGKTMLVYECDVGCGAWSTQALGRHQRHGKDEQTWKYHISMAPTSDRLCEHCGSKMHIAGPMWGGPLHNAAFVERVLEEAGRADGEVYQTLPRIEGMLDTALSELFVIPEFASQTANGDARKKNTTTADGKEAAALIPAAPPHIIDHHPFYFVPSALCKVIKAIAPPEAAIRGALRKLGYVATRSHAKAGSLKTDAPFSVIWEVLREWVRQKSPVKTTNLREGGPGHTILSKTRIGSVEEADCGAAGAAAKKADAEAEKNQGGNGDTAMTDQPTTTTTAAAAAAAGGSDSSPEGGATITVNGNGKPTTTAPTKPPQPEPGKELDVSKLDIVFDEKLGKDQEDGRQGKGGKKRLVRYQQNPRENWGPMARAKGKA